MLALEILGIVLSVPEHPYEKVRKNKPTVQIEARASDLAWRAAFVVGLWCCRKALQEMAIHIIWF